MPRPRLTEEERKRRRSERYKKWWKNKKAADPDFLKRRAAQQLQRYHFKIENEPRRTKTNVFVADLHRRKFCFNS